jgi:AraC family transcriptional regulator, regulatory protein of adaptative response / methylated-DNA-[protein]-cysteine methyltransferase
MLTFMTLTTENNHINYQRIEQAIRYLQQNFRRQPELEEVAEKVHLSPFHFQRIFTAWAGISPKRFLQYLTADYLKEKLQLCRNIEEAAAAAGLSSQSRVYDLFTTLEAVTPEEYKHRGAGIRIEYGFHETPFGNALIGITERGVCWFSFIPADEGVGCAVEEMKASWYNSIFHENQELTKNSIQQVFECQSPKKLHLFVKGTNFQVKVWEALLRIPSGALTTYQDIARKINNPKAVRAVGSAVGSNTIAYLIPCHRVIRKDGLLGEYRWSSARKKSMIGWEMARHESPNNH